MLSYHVVKRFDRAFAALIFLGFVLYFGLLSLREIWFADFAFYLSAVAALQANLLEPGHEMVAGVGLESAFLYSPYIFSIALLGKALALSPFASLQLAAILNLLLYVFAIARFFRVFSVNQSCWAAPALCLLASLLVRRFNFCWSSETSLLTFRWIQTYPSTFAWSVVILSLSEAELYLRHGRHRHLAIVGVGLWFLTISHMLSASWLVGLLVLRVMFRKVPPAEKDTGKSWAVIATIILAILATSLWPYLSALKILTLASHPENPPFGERVLEEVWYPFLLGLPALIYFFYCKQHRVLLLWFAGTWFAFLTSAALDLSFGNRFIFFQAFFLHVAIAEIITLGLRTGMTQGLRKPDRPALAITAVCIVGILASPQISEAREEGFGQLPSPFKLLTMPSNRELFAKEWAPYRSFIGEGDIVMTPPDLSPAYLATYTRSRSVVGIYAFPGSEARVEAVELFFDPNAPWSAREEVLKRYGVTKVLVPIEQAEHAKDVQKHLGDALFRGDRYLVFSAAN